MQNNNDQLDRTKELPKVDTSATEENVKNEEVTSAQQETSATEAFSESMVVEKEDVEINSEGGFDGGDTAEFVFDKEQIDAKNLQESAKDYYDATHSDSIEDKVSELCKLADASFGDDEKQDIVLPFSDDDEEDGRKKKKKSRKEKKRDKKKKKGAVSDDDIAMLTGDIDKVFSDMEQDGEQAGLPSAEKLMGEQVEDGSTEYKNPFAEEGGEDAEETEEDKLMKAFGGVRGHFKSFESVFGEDVPDEEYTDKEQEETIIKTLRKNAIFAMISVVLTLVASVFCIYFETAAGTFLPNPEIFEAGKYGVTYAMSMLQIMFLCVLFNFEGVRRAFKGLRFARPSAEGFCAVTVCVCTLHSILSAAIVSDGPQLKSFCSVGCIALLVLSVNSFIKAYTALSSFCIVASKAPKISSVNLDRSSNEAASFEKYLDNETTLFTVGKSNFVSGFFKKLSAVPAASGKTVKISIGVVAAALLAGVVCGVFSDVYSGICAFTTVCLSALPVNALLSTALPFLLATIKAKKTQTAYIGEAACDYYESTGVVSFGDTEVFPARSVKVSSIRTYGENRIDKVILYMAKVFEKVEGPLSYVFANSVQSIDDNSIEAQIVEHFADGISAKIDGKDILVGTEVFMRLYDVETPLDNIDESFTRSLGSIMYLSVDGKLASKFYVKYTMNRNFENILHAFYDAGICVGIKTLDPCITTELICGNLKGANYPVSVIKNYSKEEEAPVNSETDGAMVTLSNVHNFLKNFIRLDNLRNVYRSNNVICLFSAIVGAVLAIALNVTQLSLLGVLFIIAFQLIWCVPTVLVSIFSK